jgi:hypothetical protein
LLANPDVPLSLEYVIDIITLILIPPIHGFDVSDFPS